MDILDLIKKRTTIRKYQNKPIPKEILDKIIEAGVWGPSLGTGLQPYTFIVVINKSIMKRITDILLKKSRNIGVAGNITLRLSANTINNAAALIVIYNSSDFLKLVKKFRKQYINYAKTAELSAIAAAIQNMILVAESLNIGSCWLSAPLFCKEEIDKLLNTKSELMAILTLGRPAEEGKRSLRKLHRETVKYIK